ncbi:hypothetical protein MSAN_02106000 [Mycena sanguinolenta]|uniref:Uncharacterized protein n=1 Tax=Mycena sanguinolenta TaxID=230812 RepID=A0A8H6XHZ2_9AGAR|nr:hypothetical protein MSAN_02106000 [Mycena sanguinolenta]
MNSRGPAASLPSEIWFYIHRMATADTSPMVAAYTDRFQYWPEIDPGPLRDLGQFWRAASSFVLVSRLWNRLANELLYENIRVDHTFEALLRPALERSQNAKLVRSVLLSRDRLDHNIAVLAMCPRLQVIVQPEGTEALNSDTTPIPLSSLHFLRQIYCEESAMNSGFLRRLVALAPNLESLSLGHFSVFQASEKTLSFPTIPNLRWLTVAPIVPSLITSLFKARTVQNITRFTCAPSFFSLTDLPHLPLPAPAQPIRPPQCHPLRAHLLPLSAPAGTLLRHLEHLPRAHRNTCSSFLHPRPYPARWDAHSETLPYLPFPQISSSPAARAAQELA